MLTAVVTTSHPPDSVVQVKLLEAETCERTDLSDEEIEELGGDDVFPLGSEGCPELNPIAPEGKRRSSGDSAPSWCSPSCLRYWLCSRRSGPGHAPPATTRIQRRPREAPRRSPQSARAEVCRIRRTSSPRCAPKRNRRSCGRCPCATLEAERTAQLAAANAQHQPSKRAAAAAEVDSSTPSGDGSHVARRPSPT